MAQPKDVNSKEIDISQTPKYKDNGTAGLVNFYKNGELYFTIEAINNNVPIDSDFTKYDDLAHVMGGSSLRSSIDLYMHLASSKSDCVPAETVRGSCKTYFASKVSGSLYTYILSGFAKDLDSFGPDVPPTAYIEDHTYDNMLFSFKPNQ